MNLLLTKRLQSCLTELLFYTQPTSISVKNEAVLTAHRACPEFLTAFIADMQANIHNVLDIKEMCITACVRNKKIVNKIFQECGEKVSPAHSHVMFIKQSDFLSSIAHTHTLLHN